MKTRAYLDKLAEKIGGESTDFPSYSAVGSGTATPTRATTIVVGESYRGAWTTQTRESNVTKQELVVNSITPLASVRNGGTFDDSVAGVCTGSWVLPAEVTHSTSDNLKVISFSALKNQGVVNNFVTDGFLSEINKFVVGESMVTGTDVGFGTHLRLSKMDDIVGWTEGDAASAPTLDSYNYVEGDGSLKLGKTGVGHTTFKYSLALGGAVDCSKVTQLGVRLRVETSEDRAKLKETSAFKLKVGIDSSNYYMGELDRSDILVGWQKVKFNLSDMSLVGSVNLSNVQYLELLFETTDAGDTITHGFINADYIYGVEPTTPSDTSLADEVVRVPSTIIRNGNEVTFISIMDAATGNPYNYTQTGIWNAAVGGELLFKFTFGEKVKIDTIQIREEVTIEVDYG